VTRIRRPLRRVLVVLAVCCGGLAAWSAAAGGQAPSQPAAPDARALMARGRVLFANGCASCHGEDLRGRPEMGPPLRGAGAAAADF
jgi:ubiquinol-cytochrome c reductase cytochrome c subunit